MTFTVNMPHKFDPPLTPGPGPEVIGIQGWRPATAGSSVVGELIRTREGRGRDCDLKLHWQDGTDLAATIDQAVAAEREACAAIASECGCGLCAKFLADRIRRRKA